MIIMLITYVVIILKILTSYSCILAVVSLVSIILSSYMQTLCACDS